jgi:hypothetical protein
MESLLFTGIVLSYLRHIMSPALPIPRHWSVQTVHVLPPCIAQGSMLGRDCAHQQPADAALRVCGTVGRVPPAGSQREGVKATVPSCAGVISLFCQV